MTDKEIIKGNKLIIESPFHCTEYDLPNWNNMNKSFFIQVLKFHSSLDWLMPVVQEIISLGWQFQLNSYKTSNDATFLNTVVRIQNIAWSTPLLAIYNAVIDFIEWYNKNKTDESK